ncbi:MAG: 50S ribosomal protein L5, partial [Terriglobales bacterium]
MTVAMAKPQPKPATKPAPKPVTKPEGKPAKAAPEPRGPVRLQEHYHTKVVPSLIKEFSYTNRMQAPRLECMVLNVGMGEATQNVKLLDAAVKELATITGQHPV